MLEVRPTGISGLVILATKWHEDDRGAFSETYQQSRFQAAGIEIETLGFAPTPTNLQYLKEGKETAGLADDIAVAAWSQLDQAARELTGQKLTGPEAKAANVLQFLTQKDITFDPSKGWSGYPEFAERFAKLWGAG